MTLAAQRKIWKFELIRLKYVEILDAAQQIFLKFEFDLTEKCEDFAPIHSKKFRNSSLIDWNS